MKILLVHDFNPFLIGGGVEINTRYLASELQRIGHETIIGYQERFGLGPVPGLKTIPLGNLGSVSNIFKKFDFVVLLGSMSLRPLFVIGAQILIKQKRKFAIYFRTTSAHRPFSERIADLPDLEVDKLDIEMSKIIESPYSIVIANSSAMKNDILKTYSSVKSKEVYIVYPGTVWPKQPRVKQKTRSNKFTFVSVGRLTIDKGLLFLWEAFYRLQKELSGAGFEKKIELKIIGSGELERVLLFLTQEFSLDNSISFYGKIQHNKVFEHMTNGDALVHPALAEPFGNVIVEALGLNLPVIASDFEGPKEILENGKYGKLVPRADSWELKEAMKEIVLNEKAYKDLLKKAKTSGVRNKYNILNQARTLLEIINKEVEK